MYIIVSILPAMVEKEVSHYDNGSFSLKAMTGESVVSVLHVPGCIKPLSSS
jgi:hypothetical protein